MTTPLGKLGSLDIATANVAEQLASLDAAAIVNILCCNRNAADITIRIAIGTGVAPADKDWIEYDVDVAGNQPMERTGIAVSAGEKIWVQSSALNVSWRAHGVPAT